MAMPKYYEYMLPVLKVLSDNKEYMNRDLFHIMANQFKLTEEEKRETISSGSLLYTNRINWAITYLRQAKLLSNIKKGVFKITPLGHSVLQDNPSEINSEYLMKFEDFRNFKERTKKDRETTSEGDNQISIVDGNDNVPVKHDESTPIESIDTAYKTIKANLTDELLSEIMRQTPSFFEKLVVKLLGAMGYGGSSPNSAIVVGKSGDEGIDGIIKEDKLGFDMIYIQAKQWDITKSIGRPEIQRFVGALAGQGASKGLFITTGSFTKEAIEYAKKQHTTKTVLVDGQMLTSLMIEHNLGVSIERTIDIKKVDHDFFDELA